MNVSDFSAASFSFEQRLDEKLPAERLNQIGGKKRVPDILLPFHFHQRPQIDTRHPSLNAKASSASTYGAENGLLAIAGKMGFAI